ncbi:MAG: AAA family ATPase, partial [Verrucomicrobiota bacterium]|nr:AAA family ATPase [Verrucomicrobiota bacterium]
MLRLVINQYRAIKEAAIDLKGITVLSGVNGSGKSTVSKLLYYALYWTIHFEELENQ